MPRHLSAAFLAIFVTFGLFYLMQALILGKDMKLGEAGGTMIDFVRLKKDSELETKKRKMPEKKEPQKSHGRSSRSNATCASMAFQSS